MLKKTLAITALTGAALGLAVATAGTASAAPRHEPPNQSVSILSNACVAPWQWNGPIEAGTIGHVNAYEACNGNTAGGYGEGQHLSILDNLCVAPWQWNGPLEILTAGHESAYVACNGNTTG